MKRDRISYLLCLLFFTVLAAITFRCVFGEDMIFSASDINFGVLAFKKNSLPELFTGFFTANQVLGGSNYSFTLFNVLLAIFPVEVFANIFYGLFLVISSMAMVWFLRLWNRSWPAAVFGALVCFWFNSILLASGGHAYKVEVLALSALSLGLIEKSVRSISVKRTVGYALLAGLSVGGMMIEQQDVALLAGLFVGSYALFRLVQLYRKWGAVLLPIGAVALLLSGAEVVKSYSKNIAGDASGQSSEMEKWDYITQWSMVPSEWPEWVALGWSGWKTGDPEGPYWGKLGQSAEWETTKQGFQNFKLTSNYFGIIPFVLAGFALFVAVRNRKSEEGSQILFWGVAGLLGLGLAFGKYSILYKLFYQLPLVGNIRAPIKLLDNFQICLGIVAAYGLDRLVLSGRSDRAVKGLWIAGLITSGLMLVIALKVLAFPSEYTAEFSGMGLGNYSEIMLRNMSNAWFHAAVLALMASGCAFMVWKGMTVTKWVGMIFVGILALDSLLLTSHYFKSSDISTLKKGNIVVNYIKKNQGVERSFFLDQQGVYNQWLASDGPYHGLNLFNIWQMPRMPVEYKEFLGTVGRNQIRLWELSSIKYIAVPSSVVPQLQGNSVIGKQFKPVLNYQVLTAQGMRQDTLLEFTGAIPRFALFNSWKAVPLEQQCQVLASATHHPKTLVLVLPEADVPASGEAVAFSSVSASVTQKKATVEVTAEVPSVLRFSQRYQKGWTVYVDNVRAELLRTDYLCMGVLVPEGTHMVEFRCRNGTAQMIFSLAVVLGTLFVSGVLLKMKREV